MPCSRISGCVTFSNSQTRSFTHRGVPLSAFHLPFVDGPHADSALRISVPCRVLQKILTRFFTVPMWVFLQLTFDLSFFENSYCIAEKNWLITEFSKTPFLKTPASQKRCVLKNGNQNVSCKPRELVVKSLGFLFSRLL